MATISGNIKVYSGHELTAQDFAILMEYTTPEVDGRLRGCAITPSGTTVNLSSGWCVLHGRLVRVNGGNSITVTKPSSGTTKRHIVLTIDLVDGSVQLNARASVPDDTEDFNIASGNHVYAHLDLGTVTIGTSGITGYARTPLMRQKDMRIYTKTLSRKNLFSDKNSEYRIALRRNGYVVTCDIYYAGVLPTNKINKQEILLGSEIIPTGYRHSSDWVLRVPYICVKGNNTNYGRGQWLISKNGSIHTESGFAGYAQRCGSITWITDDDFPTSGYEDLDDS